MTDITETLNQRGKRYGEFHEQSVYADKINDVIQSSPNWGGMAPIQREGLRIIANKIGRILNGDPDYSDSWHDIAGYATLVDKWCVEKENNAAVAPADLAQEWADRAAAAEAAYVSPPWPAPLPPLPIRKLGEDTANEVFRAWYSDFCEHWIETNSTDQTVYALKGRYNPDGDFEAPEFPNYVTGLGYAGLLRSVHHHNAFLKAFVKAYA